MVQLWQQTARNEGESAECVYVRSWCTLVSLCVARALSLSGTKASTRAGPSSAVESQVWPFPQFITLCGGERTTLKNWLKFQLNMYESPGKKTLVYIEARLFGQHAITDFVCFVTQYIPKWIKCCTNDDNERAVQTEARLFYPCRLFKDRAVSPRFAFSLISSLSPGNVTVSQFFRWPCSCWHTSPALLSFPLIKAAVKLLEIRFHGHEDPSSPPTTAS